MSSVVLRTSSSVHVFSGNMKLVSAVLGILSVCSVKCDGARILGLFPIPAPSHNILGTRLMQQLAHRGHQVTMVSPFPQKESENYTSVLLSGFLEKQKEILGNVLEVNKRSFIQNIPNFARILTMYSQATLNHTNFHKLLRSNATFDLVIVEAMFNEAHVGLGHYYSAPVVMLSTVGSNWMVNKYVANPAPASMVPDTFLGLPQRMNFVQRLANTLGTTLMDVFHQFYHLHGQNALLHEHFPQAPHLQDVVRAHVALLLLNADPSFDGAKPQMPSMVHIGGYHVQEPKELPQDLKSYLDDARAGFVLFSLGSNMQSTMIPAQTRAAILEVFARLPYRVLWKFEDEQLPGKPDNVKISKWLPQNDILAHPNLRLFITHGGLLSTTEAIYHGVPILGIPIFGDQRANMARAASLGIGTTLAFTDITVDSLAGAIREVVDNKTYLVQARRRSRLLRDQPQRPIDTAMFWIEYVLRNRDTSHLQSPAVYLEWWQINMLDVYGTLAAAVILVSALVYLLLKKLCGSRKTEKKYRELKKKKN